MLLEKRSKDSLHPSFLSIYKTEVPFKVAFLLNHSRVDEVYVESLTLLYLKFYYYQIYYHGQSFELREYPFIVTRWTNSGSLVKSFLQVAQEGYISKWGGPEYIDASVVLDFLEKRPDLIKSSQKIRKAYSSVLQLRESRFSQ